MDSNGGNENYNEEEYVEQGQSSSFGQFSAGMGSAFNRADINALKNIRRNEAIGKRRDEVNSDNKTRDSLKKPSIDDGKKSEKDSSKPNLKPKIGSNGGNTSDKLSDLKGAAKGAIKSKIPTSVKLKIYLALAGIVVMIFVIAFLTVLFSSDTQMSAMSTFFGVAEKETSEGANDGLYTDEQYQFDANGNEMTDEEIIEYLNENTNCPNTYWTRFGDWISRFFSKKINNVCSFVRYVKNKTEEYEEDYGIKLDKSLVIGTVLFGYDSKVEKENLDSVPSNYDAGTSANHYENLEDMLNSGMLSVDDLDMIIEHTMFHDDYTYYKWNIREVPRNPNKPNSGTIKVGYCDATKVDKHYYSLDMWKITMRYGEALADEYEYKKNRLTEWNSTDGECKGETEPAGYDVLDASYSEANAYFKKLGKPENDLSRYLMSADVDTKTKDNLKYSYTTGFVYTKFPYYYQGMSDSNTNIEYDDTFTPKQIERVILEVIDRKIDLNEVLMLDDLDNKFWGNTINGIVTGANCMEFLTEQLNDIQVEIKDCDGVSYGTTSMEDYIIGVSYAETSIGSGSVDDYALTHMVAAISYALARNNNYSKGSTISVRSGNCWQAYCAPLKGCNAVKAHQSCGSVGACTSYIPGPPSAKRALTNSEYSRAQSLYQTAINYLLVKDGAVYKADYVSTVANKWKELALNGYSFTEILKQTYGDDGAELLECGGSNSSNNQDDNTEEDNTDAKVGNKVNGKYTNVSPNKGKYYGFAYANEGNNSISIDPKWKEANLTTVSSNCSAAGWNSEYTVHTKAADSFKKAFSNVCNILTNGVKISNGKTCNYSLSDLSGGGTFNEVKTTSGSIGLEAYGLTQDWNYSKSQYNGNLDTYNEFINSIGGEENCENVNYILYKYAYEPAGFNWGGNYQRKGNSGTFNPKRFEIKY